jgi:predicted nucleic acid-binding protein
LLGRLADLDHLSSPEPDQPLEALGRSHRLTACDAAYLELAARNDLPLASQDEQLLEACRAVGVAVVEPNP